MRLALFAALTAALAVVVPASGKGTTACNTSASTLPDTAPVVQIALLLDTSNSMDGLIDQARAQLWEVVNQFTHARRGPRPAELQVALYEYGNSRLSGETGWVRRVLPFTSDLDRVSEALFALQTEGGDEYCGTVIQAALDQLRWGTRPGDLRVIFIAGNEPFTQGPVSPRSAVQRAAARGIVVNTIPSGQRAVGESTGWGEGARLAGGAYSVIDQEQAIVHIDAPQDAEIARLGVELNKTYVPYGVEGIAGQQRQAVQDTNAANWKGSAVNRAVSKANHLYSNSTWDLVDAVNQKQVEISKVKAETLPEALRGLSQEGLRQVLLEKNRERERIQKEINRLAAERDRHVARERLARKVPQDTLDAVMTTALREQAACRSIELQ
jgi:hypothetical protein